MLVPELQAYGTMGQVPDDVRQSLKREVRRHVQECGPQTAQRACVAVQAGAARGSMAPVQSTQRCSGSSNATGG